ncbi:uncharacterized protein LOC135129953 [Zophobas morio]|uniref:uncharacterized protein LOC135129953 n=1 Tax=Zophobas morio TaxID=2755281 RepID=UPI00308345C7
MQTTALVFQLGLTTVHHIVKQCCAAIWETLAPIYLKPPTTTEEWKKIASEFYTFWDFPNCLGAIDGKQISIQTSAGSGSLDLNYKKDVSIVLLACADASYRFTFIDVGAYGFQNDGGLFGESIFGLAFDTKALNVPSPSYLPGTETRMPYTLVADKSFPLKSHIMRPYPGKNVQLRELARWRILRTTIVAKAENVDNIVKAAVCLHNFVKKENETVYCPPGYVDSADAEDGLWRSEIEALPSVGRGSNLDADDLKIYHKVSTLEDCLLIQKGMNALMSWCLSNRLLLGVIFDEKLTFTQHIIL